MQAPARSGSTFFTYKNTHSIVLMVACDSNYKFTMVDIGDLGRNSDNFGIAISEDKLNIPKAESIWGSEFNFPFVFVGDEAFPLRTNVMKPYPRDSLAMEERVFNYRLSRCRLSSKIHLGYLYRDFGFFAEQLSQERKLLLQ